MPFDWNALQYVLGGAGAALGGPGSWQAALGQVAQQDVKTKNFNNLVNTLLGGGGSMKMDGKGTTVTMPHVLGEGTVAGVSDANPNATQSAQAPATPKQAGSALEKIQSLLPFLLAPQR